MGLNSALKIFFVYTTLSLLETIHLRGVLLCSLELENYVSEKGLIS